MSIKVDTVQLQRKSTFASSLAMQLNEKASQVNSIYYTLDSEVKSRQSIEYSLRSLQQRMQKAQQRMSAIGNFLSVTANQYSNAESVLTVRATAVVSLGIGNAAGTGKVAVGNNIVGVGQNTGAVNGKAEGKKWYQKNWFKIAVGGFVITASAVAAVTVGSPIMIGMLVGATIGAGVGGVIGGVTSRISGGNFRDGFADGFMWGAIGGAASGAVGATTKLGALCAVGAEGTINSAIYAGETMQNGGRITAEGVAKSFVVGAAFSAVGTVAAKKISQVVGSKAKGIVEVDNVGKGVSNPNNINKYSLSGEEHYQALKDIFGEDNVEWTSKTTISQSERLKISNWDFTPSDELYIKYKDVYKNELYYNQATGKINWPSNYGFLEEVPNEVTVNPSMILDRYGEPTGQFMANATDSYESRALAPHSENAKHYYYKPTEEFTMDAGTVAPWFGSNGGATQYLKYHSNEELYTVEELLHDGLLEDITDLVEKGLISLDK